MGVLLNGRKIVTGSHWSMTTDRPRGKKGEIHIVLFQVFRQVIRVIPRQSHKLATEAGGMGSVSDKSGFLAIGLGEYQLTKKRVHRIFNDKTIHHKILGCRFS